MTVQEVHAVGHTDPIRTIRQGDVYLRPPSWRLPVVSVPCAGRCGTSVSVIAGWVAVGSSGAPCGPLCPSCRAAHAARDLMATGTFHEAIVTKP